MSWDGKLTQLDVARILSCEGSLRLLVNSERKLFFLLVDGITVRIAAARLGINVNTAGTRRSSIYRKLGFHSIQDLHTFAMANGLA